MNQRESFEDNENGTAVERITGIFLQVSRRGMGILMNFTFKWKHRDGSIVEFSAQGLRSDDPEKATG